MPSDGMNIKAKSVVPSFGRMYLEVSSILFFQVLLEQFFQFSFSAGLVSLIILL